MSKSPDPRRRLVRVVRDATGLKTRREDAVRSGNLLELEEPAFLSAVKRPANRSPFKVVRDANGAVARGDQPLRAVTLPAGATDEEAQHIFREFDFSEDDYEIKREGDVVRFVAREDAEAGEETVTIWLASGIAVEVKQGAIQRGDAAPEDSPQLAVVKYVFSPDKFTQRADVEQWLETTGVSGYEKEDLFQIAGEYVLRRHDTDEKLLKIAIRDEGVDAYVACTDRLDVPQRIYRQVIEEAYGRWGWGTVSFMQMMANETFSRDGRDAVFMLWDVLDNILFYSELPLDDRKALMRNALAEFEMWMTMLIDILPRSAIEAEGLVNQRDEPDEAGDPGDGATATTEATKETADMSEDKGKQTRAKREDESPASVSGSDKGGAGDGTDVQRGEGEQSVKLTRSELDELLQDAAAKAVEKVQGVKRSDDGADDGDGGDKGGAAGDGGKDSGLIQRLDKLEEENKELKKFKEKAEETIVREEAEDEEEDPEAVEKERENVKRNDPYRGAFFRRTRLYD